MKIVITAPSLDEHRNVSGISTIVRQIIEHSQHDFAHFKAGREDGEQADLKWLAKQAVLPFRFFACIKKERADLVHINTALTDLSIWRDAALSRAARIARRPLVLSVHGGKYLVNEFKNPRMKRVTETMLRTAKSVVVYSDLEKAEVERRWKGLDIRVLPNAVPQREDAAAERNNDVPVIIFFGRLHESKGLDEIIKACTQLKNDGFDFRFNCFGDGPMKDTFIPRMESALGGRFHYGGVLTGSDKYRELDRADIFLLPSIYGEGLPMAILEAMAAGCVIVASEMASVAAVIEDGVNGYLIEPRNTNQLVSRLKILLDGRGDWKPVSQAAVETVRDKFAISSYIEKLEEIYWSAAA
jgi:glycosyltransferase involved in cell wall biosynthesis